MSDLVPVTVLVPVSELKSLYAFLGGAAVAALAVGSVGSPVSGNVSAPSVPTNTAPINEPSTLSVPVPVNTSAADGERDAAGVLWDPERHASTRTKTGAGLWRMKVGVSRPEHESAPAAGNPGTGTSAATPSSTVNGSTAGAASTPAIEEDDEFAAFRAAAAPASTLPAVRNWSDGDLSKLCNQAALKAGGPEGVKELIAKFVPEGAVPHSRNIAADQREDFAKAVETAFGIVYEG